MHQLKFFILERRNVFRSQRMQAAKIHKILFACDNIQYLNLRKFVAK